MSNRIPSVVRFYIRLFQFIGCFDASLHTQPNEQKLAEHRLVTWTNILLLIFSLTTVNTFFRPHAFLFVIESFGYFVDALKVCIAQLTVSIIYIETVFRRCSLRRFWQRYALLNPSILKGAQSKKGNWFTQLYVHCRFHSIYWGMTAFELTIQIIYFIRREKNYHKLQFWAMFCPYIYLAHLRNMQIIFHLEIMRLEFEKLRNDIGLLAEYTCFARRIVPFAGFEDFVRRKLAEKQLVFQHIQEMFDYLQQAFGISSIAVILMSYVRLVVDTYFILYNQASGLGFLDEAAMENLLMLPAYLEIPALLLTSQKCMNVVKFIAFELHNIRGSMQNSIISIQIQNFSLQMLHQKIRIDGLGISTLDGKMLVRIAGSITTYMVFFIQFMPKFRNL